VVSVTVLDITPVDKEQQLSFDFIEIKEKKVKKSGIYFLSDNKKLIYIGQSVDLFNRPFTHKKEKKFDKVEVYECEEHWLNYLESAFVGMHRPSLNGWRNYEKNSACGYGVRDELAFKYCHQALKIYNQFKSQNFTEDFKKTLGVECAHAEIRLLTLDLSNQKSKKIGSEGWKRAAIKRIIDSYKPYELFKEIDVAEINKITGWNFVGYKKVTNIKYPLDHRCVAHTSDGVTWEIWSWNKAITGNLNSLNLSQAMRLAVSYQVQIFRAISLNQTCAICGCSGKLHVDHKSKPFSLIKNEFIEKHPHIVHSIESRGHGWRIAWPELLVAWQTFHERNADYQMLCASCNLRKGTKCP